MTRAGIVSGIVAVVALGLATGPLAHAQKPTSTTTGGAFDSLSPGNQKVASALYQAQNGSTSTPLTLDEIAARKQGGQGWGEVFKSMKAQGLVQEKNLGKVVSKYNHSTKGVVATASGRTVSGSASGGKAHGAKGGDGSIGHGSSAHSSGASTGKGNAFGAGHSSAGGGVAHGHSKGGK